MSKNILDALMQLFALITLREEGLDRGREVVAGFLRSRLNRDQVQAWLDAFEAGLVKYGGSVETREVAGLKRTALRSTKVLRACADINRDLQASEKALVFLRVLEFEMAISPNEEDRDALGRELMDLVASGFGIREGEQRCYETLVFRTDQWPTMTQRYHEAFIIGDQPQLGGVIKTGWNTPMACFRHPEAQVVFLRPMGQGAIQLNGELLDPQRTQPFTPGSTLRHPGAAPLHFVDIQRSFMEEENIPDFTLRVHELSHWFHYPDNQAIHPISVSASSGMLVGIMGASGSGKSTLVHLLAGSEVPTFGNVTLDGVPVTDPKVKSRIGLVPQSDHLLPELTVEENLHYAARLAFGQDDPEQTKAKVHSCLEKLGLWDARSLPVGDALNKTISGGQRKRLNIALELIREPQILLVDEPTSGLSSKDSELLMDLLKQLTYGGTLVITVIHQPSGDIFRSLDALWVMDQGGYPVFTGRPLDALTHFRTMVNHHGAEDVACVQCGHVNPEQIFDIIEVPVLDGRGKSTGQRRISPKEWNDFYNVLIVPGMEPQPSEDIPPIESPQEEERPTWARQWVIQAQRDIKRKLKNPQYLLINLLEAPVLALLLALLLRAADGGKAYVYGQAENVPHFLFIAVIVAIFMGLTVSAEELFRDRLMRKREAHLQLDWSAYLTSKVAVLFGISAIQTLLFASISHPILALPGHFGSYAFTLLSVSACANLFGLCMSLMFNSVRVIYLAIPLFIIPQLLLGGAIVPFDRMNPGIAKETSAPWPAQLTISRWGFEALATLYASENRVDAILYPADKAIALAAHRRDHWIPEMERQLKTAAQGEENAIRLLARQTPTLVTPPQVVWEDGLQDIERERVEVALSVEKEHAKQAWIRARAERDRLLTANGWDEPAQFASAKAEAHNEVLHDWVTRRQELSASHVVSATDIINKRDALYAAPKPLGADTFYAAETRVMGATWSKTKGNWVILWSATSLLVLMLGWGRALRRRDPSRQT